MQPLSRRRLLLAALAAAALPAGLAIAPSAQAQDYIIVPREPPRSRHERIPPRPRGTRREDVIWEPGHWEWHRNRWVWEAGHWERRPRGRDRDRWVHGHWEQHDRDWRWHRGRWAD